MNKSKYSIIKDAISDLEINQDTALSLPVATTKKQKQDRNKLLNNYRKTINELAMRTGKKFRTKTTETDLLIQRIPVIELPTFSK